MQNRREMGAVYGGAYVVQSATSPGRSEVGFLSPRPSSCAITLEPIDGGMPCMIYTRPAIPQLPFRGATFQEKDDDYRNYSVLKRGWRF